MLVSEKLHQFYLANNLPINGGENESYFYLTFRYFSFKIPNFKFRKKVIHIHDIQHILYNKDITWKGEAFIAGWEIATGIWKHFPINILSFWAMGIGLLLYPKEVLKGYKAGLPVQGIIDLKISKKEILKLNISDLASTIQKEKPRTFNTLTYSFNSLIALIIVCFPLIAVLILLYYNY